MNRMVLSFGLSAALLGATLVACAGNTDDLQGTPLTGQENADDGGSSPRSKTPGAGDTCTDSPSSGTVEKIDDPSVLPACGPACDGAHCVPTAKVPSSAKAALATCSGGYCVPDPLIKSR